MPLAAGTRLGPYEITAQIGVGGMGEVYRATDTNLKRAVAIKVLPDAVASDAERLARFQREAEVLASLNHPNIAAIYGLERTETSTALVMELVDGPTLAERTAGGPIPIDDALPLAKQIAEALEAAHEQDIIHRDLKPGNVKVRPDGTLKVLDFGLAKAVAPAGMTATNITQSPTITRPSLLTRSGMLLGTAAYMAPEQARGKAVDQRADIWAFGCVLFEMLTGTRAFEAENIPATLADVITRNPDWSALPPNTPAAIRTLLRRCLEKDPKRRLQAIGDARLELDEALSGASASADSLLIAPMPPSQLRRWLPIAATAVIAALVVGGLMWIWRRPGPLAVVRVNVMPGDGSAVGDATRTPDIAITPDGQRIVYAAGQSTETTQLFVRGLDQLDALPLKGVGDGAYGPFLSPDGEWVGYFAGGAIHKVSITGGPPVMICAANRPLGASWGPNDQMVFSSNAALFRVSAGGGKPELLAAPHISKVEATYGYPEILPGGRAVLFTIVPNASPGDRNQIAVLDLETRRTRVLIRGGSTPRYAPSGHLVYAAAGSLRAVRFDVDRLEMHGNPVPVVEHVATKGLTGAANFGIARSGTTLVYRTGTAVVGLLHTMVWIDRHGQEEPLGLAPRAYVRADLSPDGTKLALDIRDQENDIWVWDLTRRGPLTPLTFDPGLNRGGLWSPDGRKIAFTAVLTRPRTSIGRPRMAPERLSV